MNILQRLGMVSWWFGTLTAGALLLCAVGAAITAGLADASYVFLAALGLAVLVPAWALCFVLAGSFWKPPRAR